MNWRYLLPSAFTAMLSGIFIAPKLAHAASGFFGPIWSGECLCPNGGAPDFGCVLIILQKLINLGVSMAVVFVVLIAAYAGVQFILSGGSPEVRSQAKNMLLNVVVGLALILSAWLIVDFVMKTIYDPNKAGQNFGPWNSILASNAVKCIYGRSGEAITDGAVSALDLKDSPATADLAGSPLATGQGGACDAIKVQQGARAGGYTLTDTQARTLACLAQPESDCGANNINYNWNGRKDPSNPSTAAGAFQVTLKGNSPCYNNVACSSAAGISGNLDCKNAFDSHGNSIKGTLLDNCLKAASNLACSSSAAACMVKAAGGNNYHAWVTDKSNANQKGCISRNGGTY